MVASTSVVVHAVRKTVTCKLYKVALYTAVVQHPIVILKECIDVIEVVMPGFEPF